MSTLLKENKQIFLNVFLFSFKVYYVTTIFIQLDKSTNILPAVFIAKLYSCLKWFRNSFATILC